MIVCMKKDNFSNGIVCGVLLVAGVKFFLDYSEMKSKERINRDIKRFLEKKDY